METNEELCVKCNPVGSELRNTQSRMFDMLLYLAKCCGLTIDIFPFSSYIIPKCNFLFLNKI